MPRRTSLWLAVLMTGLSAVAQATQIVPLDLAALVAQAETVALGRVEARVGRWTSSHDAIYTEVTLRVTEGLKGPVRVGQRVVVRREGGEVDGMGMKVIGAADFAVGEEVVVFLERRGASLWTVGMAQGKLHVGLQAGRKMAFRDVAGLAFLGAPPREPPSEPLDDLRGRIAAQVAAERRDKGVRR